MVEAKKPIANVKVTGEPDMKEFAEILLRIKNESSRK